MTTKPAIKGVQFAGPDDPKVPANVRRMSPEKRREWWKEYVERWQIVATCTYCGEGMVQEELVAHRLNHTPDALRPVSRILAGKTPAERLLVLQMFCSECGALESAEKHSHR